MLSEVVGGIVGGISAWAGMSTGGIYTALNTGGSAASAAAFSNGVGILTGGLGGVVGQAVSQTVFPSHPQKQTPSQPKPSYPTPTTSPTTSSSTGRSTTNYGSPLRMSSLGTSSSSRVSLPGVGSSSRVNTASSSYVIRSGDTLWGIASMFYGSGFQWQRIYQANQGVIGGNPNLIFPGERLTLNH